MAVDILAWLCHHLLAAPHVVVTEPTDYTSDRVDAAYAMAAKTTCLLAAAAAVVVVAAAANYSFRAIDKWKSSRTVVVVDREDPVKQTVLSESGSFCTYSDVVVVAAAAAAAAVAYCPSVARVCIAVAGTR